MMQKSVQVGDVVVVQNEDNSTYMCKDATKQTKGEKFIRINMGYPVVKSVNGENPDSTGELDLNGTHINATVKGYNDTIQNHLQTIDNNINIANNNFKYDYNSKTATRKHYIVAKM